MKNLYKVLGVPKSATQDEIKKAYHALAKELHPDRNPNDKKAEDKFKAVTAAYGTLSSPEKRKLYDKYGEDSTSPGFTPPTAPRPRVRRAKRQREEEEEEEEQDSRGWNESPRPDEWSHRVQPAEWGHHINPETIWDALRGKGNRGGASDIPLTILQGAHIEEILLITLEEARTGGQKIVTIPKPMGDPIELSLQIPPGVLEGDRLRLAGMGMPGQFGGGAGDLLLRVSFQPHPWFTPMGSDLLLDLPVTLAEAVRGGTVEVPILDGRVRIKVPPMSQSGKKMRLPGKGLLDRKTKRTGDILVTIQIALPDGDLDEITAVADKLAPLYESNPRQIFERWR